MFLSVLLLLRDQILSRHRQQLFQFILLIFGLFIRSNDLQQFVALVYDRLQLQKKPKNQNESSYAEMKPKAKTENLNLAQKILLLMLTNKLNKSTMQAHAI